MAKHLNYKEKIDKGSFYTPKKLVDLLSNILHKHIEVNRNTTFVDLGVGSGAFLNSVSKYDNFIGVDIDSVSIDKLMNNFTDVNVYDVDSKNFVQKQDITNRNIFIGNALTSLTRDRDDLDIDNDDYLVAIGNPPFNDVTSQNKSLIKDSFVKADEDIKTRDLGITFMRAYNRLSPDIVCIIHPLSYLIKKANFNLLKEFKDNYILKESLIFSSSEFEDTKGNPFPLTISMYKRCNVGMDYDYIRVFNFDVLGEDFTFKLDDYKTTDGLIHKYPNQNREKDIGIYFHTFRDNNSILRSATFRSNKTKSSIFVNIKNLYQYCYLDWYKDNYDGLFYDTGKYYIFGNLSPLLLDKYKDKSDLVRYSYESNKELRSILDNDTRLRREIEHYYSIDFGGV